MPESRHETLARLYNKGMTNEQIRAAMGYKSTQSVGVAIWRARQHGLIPPRQSSARGRKAYRRMQQTGAAPHMGTIGEVLDMLSMPQLNQALDMHRDIDTPFSHTLAMLIREALDARSNQTG